MTDLRAAGPRVGVGARLASTMMAASLVQFSIGALAPFIVADLGMSRTRLGVLISCYYLVAAVASPLLGRLTGLIGGRAGLRLVALLAVAGCLSVAVAPVEKLLWTGLFFAGLAVAAANPATNLAIAGLRPPHGVLVGVKQSGFQMAGVVAGGLMPLIAHLYGWRASFAAGAAMGGIVLASLVRWPDAGGSPDRRGQRSRGTNLPAGAGALAAYAFLMGIGIATVNVYLALFAHDRLLLSEQHAGLLVGVAGLAAVIARIGWNLVLERGTGRLATERNVLILIAAVAVAATGMTILAEPWAVALVWVGAAAIGFSAAAWNGVVMLSLVRSSTDGTSLARASGRVQGAFFMGLAAGPVVFGWLVDRTGAYAVGWLWTAASFLVALGVAAVAMPSRPARSDAG